MIIAGPSNGLKKAASIGSARPITIDSATAIVPWRPKKASSAISLLRADIPIAASGWLCRNLALGEGGRGFVPAGTYTWRALTLQF